MVVQGFQSTNEGVITPSGKLIPNKNKKDKKVTTRTTSEPAKQTVAVDESGAPLFTEGSKHQEVISKIAEAKRANVPFSAVQQKVADYAKKKNMSNRERIDLMREYAPIYNVDPKAIEQQALKAAYNASQEKSKKIRYVAEASKTSKTVDELKENSVYKTFIERSLEQGTDVGDILDEVKRRKDIAEQPFRKRFAGYFDNYVSNIFTAESPDEQQFARDAKQSFKEGNIGRVLVETGALAARTVEDIISPVFMAGVETADSILDSYGFEQETETFKENVGRTFANVSNRVDKFAEDKPAVRRLLDDEALMASLELVPDLVGLGATTKLGKATGKAASKFASSAYKRAANIVSNAQEGLVEQAYKIDNVFGVDVGLDKAVKDAGRIAGKTKEVVSKGTKAVGSAVGKVIPQRAKDAFNENIGVTALNEARKKNLLRYVKDPNYRKQVIKEVSGAVEIKKIQNAVKSVQENVENLTSELTRTAGNAKRFLKVTRGIETNIPNAKALVTQDIIQAIIQTSRMGGEFGRKALGESTMLWRSKNKGRFDLTSIADSFNPLLDMKEAMYMSSVENVFNKLSKTPDGTDLYPNGSLFDNLLDETLKEFYPVKPEGSIAALELLKRNKVSSFIDFYDLTRNKSLATSFKGAREGLDDLNTIKDLMRKKLNEMSDKALKDGRISPEEHARLSSSWESYRSTVRAKALLKDVATVPDKGEINSFVKGIVGLAGVSFVASQAGLITALFAMDNITRTTRVMDEIFANPKTPLGVKEKMLQDIVDFEVKSGQKLEINGREYAPDEFKRFFIKRMSEKIQQSGQTSTKDIARQAIESDIARQYEIHQQAIKDAQAGLNDIQQQKMANVGEMRDMMEILEQEHNDVIKQSMAQIQRLQQDMSELGKEVDELSRYINENNLVPMTLDDGAIQFVKQSYVDDLKLMLAEKQLQLDIEIAGRKKGQEKTVELLKERLEVVRKNERLETIKELRMDIDDVMNGKREVYEVLDDGGYDDMIDAYMRREAQKPDYHDYAEEDPFSFEPVETPKKPEEDMPVID